MKKKYIKVKTSKKDKSKNKLIIIAVIGIVVICAFILYLNKAPSKMLQQL